MSTHPRNILAGVLLVSVGIGVWWLAVRTGTPPSRNSPVDALEFSGVTADGGRSTNLLAAGGWSEPVTDSAGYTLRGRLLIFDTPYFTDTNSATGIAREWWGNAPVYLELQNLSPRDDEPLAVYFDLQDGLDCEVTTPNGDAAQTSQIGFFSGSTFPFELQYWSMVPFGGSVRLRADPQRGGFSPKTNGIVLQFGLAKRWIIPAASSNSYYLAGDFSAPTNHPVPPGAHVWSGTLKLPRVAIPASMP
jgi:hypothetical protein